ncbi:YqgE/AlgH family protein [Candidatus Methylomirabilis sp.]|uniref:YqgE/AlgH family protein n=1 Tax=Candidatus Methylomirabilis sp. TaxID=2032687 RepID=UPI002A68BE6F|nr:YqgE/AlgH family protein [Candidatus Methylomirabilis sp.]
MVISAQFVSNIADPPRQHRRVPRRVKAGSLLWFLATLAVIAGLLTSGSGLLLAAGATTRMAAASQSATLAGQLLVAKDELRDPRFVRSVIYLLHHDANGAMGLILNRPVGEASLSELLKDAGLEGTGVKGKIRVHFGGPVDPGLGFVLHTADYKIEGTKVVKNGIAVTAQPEILRAIGARTGPHKSLFALGYAGWAPSQLEAEIKAGAWEIVPADEALVFDENAETKWERALARRTIRL